VVHRDHSAPEGACARITWLKGDRDSADRAADVYRMAVLPRIQEFDGFCSASMLVNRATGRALVTVAYDSRAALDAAKERSNALRERTANEMSATVQAVQEFDLVLAHLHVPEMA